MSAIDIDGHDPTKAMIRSRRPIIS